MASTNGRMLLAVLLAALFLAGPARAQMFNPQSFTLKNGLQVVVIPNHRVPIVTHMLWYKVGSADEEPGKSGLAHMLEHMMFKGTSDVPAGRFSQIVAANGGRENAFTTADYTAFFQDVAVAKLPLVMKLEADRMAHLALSEPEFEPERQVVMEERRMRIENQPSALLDEQMEASLFLNSPYHHPVIGWKNEIEGYRLADIAAFYHRWYAPNNAILVVAGDITAQALKPLAEKYYGAIPAHKVPVRLRPAEPLPVAARRIELRDETVREPSWSRLYLAPSYRAGETRFAYPLQVLAEIVGGGETSRLNRALVVEGKLAADISAGYDPVALGPSSFYFAADPAPGIPLDRLEAAMVKEIAALARDGVSEAEVEQAKSRLKARTAYARDSYRTGAHVLGMALCSGQSIDDVESWPAHIAAVTRDQVNEAAAAIFKDERSVTGLLEPAAPGQGTTEGLQRAAGAGAAGGLFGREIR